MKARQEKKNFKKAIDLLNELNVEDWDAESEGILYVYVEDNANSRKILNRVCGLLKLDHGGFMNLIRINQEENVHPEPLIDLVYLYNFIKFPRRLDLFFSGKNGFSLKYIPDELV